MNSDKENLSSEESLEIISRMIQAAKGTVVDNSFYFLLWGWVCVFANLTIYYLVNYTQIQDPNRVWLIALPTALVSFIYGYFKSKNYKVHTYAGSVTFWIWMCFMACLVVILVFMSKHNFQTNPLIMLMAAMATFLSGITLKFKPLVLGGISFWILSIVAFMSSYENQLLLQAVALIIGYLIPGYLLKKRSRNG